MDWKARIAEKHVIAQTLTNGIFVDVRSDKPLHACDEYSVLKTNWVDLS